MAYTFNTTILSAQKFSNPPVTNAALSATGVEFLSGNNVKFAEVLATIVSLSTNDVGLAFNKVSVTVEATSLSTFNLTAYPSTTLNVLGSVFTIPAILTGSLMAVITLPVNNLKTFTTFGYLSSDTVLDPLSATVTTDVVTADTLRLHNLGYR